MIGCEDRLRNDLYCVEWGVKLYSNQPSLRTINIAGSGAPKTAGGGYGGARPGKCSGHRPADDGLGNHRLPPSRQTPLDNRTTSRGGWARETAGSGRVSGAMAHLSKSRRAARRRDAIADRMLGVGDHRPDVGRGWMMADGTFYVCSNAAVNSDLSCLKLFPIYTVEAD